MLQDAAIREVRDLLRLPPIDPHPEQIPLAIRPMEIRQARPVPSPLLVERARGHRRERGRLSTLRRNDLRGVHPLSVDIADQSVKNPAAVRREEPGVAGACPEADGLTTVRGNTPQHVRVVHVTEEDRSTVG